MLGVNVQVLVAERAKNIDIAIIRIPIVRRNAIASYLKRRVVGCQRANMMVFDMRAMSLALCLLHALCLMDLLLANSSTFLIYPPISLHFPTFSFYGMLLLHLVSSIASCTLLSFPTLYFGPLLPTPFLGLFSTSSLLKPMTCGLSSVRRHIPTTSFPHACCDFKSKIVSNKPVSIASFTENENDPSEMDRDNIDDPMCKGSWGEWSSCQPKCKSSSNESGKRTRVWRYEKGNHKPCNVRVCLPRWTFIAPEFKILFFSFVGSC